MHKYVWNLEAMTALLLSEAVPKAEIEYYDRNEVR